VLPGVGASVAGLAAYAQAVQTSKTPERFGKGAVEGVIAPDATARWKGRDFSIFFLWRSRRRGLETTQVP
jgi:TctA family transporter